MVATTCPAPEELRNYALGRLSEAQWEAIDGHVESCAECQAALATVDDVADTLLTRLRGPAPEDDFLKESQCEAALARARHLASHAHASGGEAPGSPPFRELGEYQVLEELGQGGMGAVYKALHKKLDRVVAVKILARGRSGDERAIARFEREMKAVGRFDHPHIVRAYDAREIGGSPVLVMEFVEGMDLGRLVQRLGPLPIADACELVRQSAAGLQYVHEQGLVHRDLKPSNLMLTPQGTVKILDLGLALFHFDQPSGEVTHTGQAMGTVDYMAPEQASDSHAVDIRADIYSLGCTLYKLLTGRAPFEGGDYKGTFEKMTAHVHQPVPPIADLLPQIPKELAAVIQRMLAKEPANRFAQPADVVEALTPFCWDADLPELIARAAAKETSFSQPLPAFSPAPPPSSLPRPATLSLRLRTFVAIAVGLLMLGGGIGFALGILITIKKDGKTTALEVPAGQKVQIDEQGNATVDVDGSTNKGLKRNAGSAPRADILGINRKVATITTINTTEDVSGSGYSNNVGEGFSQIDLNAEGGKAAIPPEPYTIEAGDSLRISATGTFWDQPIDGIFMVEPTGTVALGPAYGRVKVQGLSLVEAEKAITTKLMEVLAKPRVSVTLAGWRSRSKSEAPPPPHRIAPGDILDISANGTLWDQPIHGPYLVEPDGQVTLGPAYGRVNLKGLIFEEAEGVVLKKLREILREPLVSITLGGWRKEIKQPPRQRPRENSPRENRPTPKVKPLDKSSSPPEEKSVSPPPSYGVPGLPQGAGLPQEEKSIPTLPGLPRETPSSPPEEKTIPP